MPYVQRTNEGIVTGLFANPQPGYAEEFLADNHADVLVFLDPPPVPPPPAPPPSLSRRQLLLALLSIGVTADMVAAEIEAIADPIERAAAMIEWTAASSYERDHPLVVDLAAAFGLPAGQVDDLWTWAASL